MAVRRHERGWRMGACSGCRCHKRQAGGLSCRRAQCSLPHLTQQRACELTCCHHDALQNAHAVSQPGASKRCLISAELRGSHAPHNDIVYMAGASEHDCTFQAQS